MKKITFYDTETTGLPNWKVPSNDESQPHIVQLGAIVCNAETREIIKEIDVIVKPDGWTIPDEVAAIHGITTEIALEKGIPETEAIKMLLDECCGIGERVAHNRTFDQRIVRIGLKRHGFSEEQMDMWADKDDHHDTMLLAKPIMKMGPKNRYGYKSPKLEEAYEHFTGKKLENAHTAMADARACMEVYWAIKDLDGNDEQ
ncbi:3'-5' exonuclease [Vibrio fluvialis]|nr:3'-5' exonuclease [Vibrio fluvialis]